MTENPINPAALYDYAASKNDMDSLRPEERTFLEACAWEWERLIDHGAEEWGKQFEALGIKPGVPQAPSAKPTPAAPEKPAPSSPAAERADEGLEEEAERLREAYTNDEGSWLEWPDCRQEPWLRVARTARALRRGGVTEEPWGIVDDLALSGKVTDTMTAGQPARSRLRNELSAAVRERDALAAKLAEAERERDYYKHEHKQADESLCEMALIAEERKLALSGMDDALSAARADAERLRGERDEARDTLAGTEEFINGAPEDAALLAAGSALCALMRDGCGDEPDRYASAVYSFESDVRAYVARLRTAPPTVAVTDVEKAAREIGSETASYAHEMLAILRKHTRSVSVEEVANALRDELNRPGGADRLELARRAIRALGVREAEKNATPFVVDRESVAQAIDAAWVAQPFNTYHAADAAIAEIERQRAEHAAKGGAS